MEQSRSSIVKSYFRHLDFEPSIVRTKNVLEGMLNPIVIAMFSIVLGD